MVMTVSDTHYALNSDNGGFYKDLKSIMWLVFSFLPHSLIPGLVQWVDTSVDNLFA